MADTDSHHCEECKDYCCCCPPVEEDFVDEPERLPDGTQRITIFRSPQPKPEIPIAEGMVEKVVPACGCGRYQRVVSVPKESA